MEKKKFIVFEGDNGAGKDTTAQEVAKEGYTILTYLPEVKAKENASKVAKDKTLGFLAYNDFCSKLVQEKAAEPTMLIRYWISTLAAAYCDFGYSYEQVMDLTDKLVASLEKPTCVIRLRCDHDARVQRINLRNAQNPELEDDITLDRAVSYAEISRAILMRSGYNWKEFDTSHSTPTELAKQILDFVEKGE